MGETGDADGRRESDSHLINHVSSYGVDIIHIHPSHPPYYREVPMHRYHIIIFIHMIISYLRTPSYHPGLSPGKLHRLSVEPSPIMFSCSEDQQALRHLQCPSWLSHVVLL